MWDIYQFSVIGVLLLSLYVFYKIYSEEIQEALKAFGKEE